MPKIRSNDGRFPANCTPRKDLAKFVMFSYIRKIDEDITNLVTHLTCVTH